MYRKRGVSAPFEDAGGPHKAARTGESEDELYEIAFKKIGKVAQGKLESLYTSGQMNRGDLDSRCMQSLSSFTQKEILDIIEQFGAQNLDGIRKKSAYLQRLMKHYREDPKGSQRFMQSKESKTATREELLDQIVPAIKKKIDELVSMDVIKEEDVDDRCLEFLSQLPGRVGLQAVEELGRQDLSDVRNKSAYFQTICRRTATNAGLPFEAGGTADRGPPAGRGASYESRRGDTGGYSRSDDHRTPRRPTVFRDRPAPFERSQGGPPGYSGSGGWNGEIVPQYTQVSQPSFITYEAQIPNGMMAAPGSTPGHFMTQQMMAPETVYEVPREQPVHFAQLPQQYVIMDPTYLQQQQPIGKNPGGSLALRQHPKGHQLSVRVRDKVAELAEMFGVELDQQAWEMLLQMTDQSAFAALRDLQSALQSGQAVRNVCAYFTGVARKHMELKGTPHIMGGSTGYRTRGVEPSNSTLISELDPEVQTCLLNHCDDHRFRQQDFDARALSMLGKLSTEDGVAALDQFAKNDIKKVRNPSAFFTNICANYLRT